FELVLALEGSFINAPTVANGDQVVFTRVRVRATGVVPGATYTITHPWGVETLIANGVPPRLINFTRDTGFVPLQFGLALNGAAARFLTYASGPVPPPPGMVGNPAANQSVTGSPCGNNFFRVEGAGLPSGGIQTDQFTLTGRIANVCGNGILDHGEQGDHANTADRPSSPPPPHFPTPLSAFPNP